jgi:prepilin-type N-terminal cleavage/methylation domain-containing protein
MIRSSATPALPVGPTTRAFSLIEVLVAMAVLSLIMVLMVQISDGILASTRIQNQQLDSVATARRAVDIMYSDISSAIVGPTATLLVRENTPNTPFLAMVSQRFGPSTAPANYRCLAIQYVMDGDGNLFRRNAAVAFGDNLLQKATENIPTPDIPVASGILGFTLRIITTDTSSPVQELNSTPSPSWAVPSVADTTYNGLSVPAGWKALVPPGSKFVTEPTKTSRALEIWVAAIEPQSYRLLEETGKLTAARNVFQGSNPSTWRNQFDAADIPPTVKSSLRIINKTVPLP